MDQADNPVERLLGQGQDHYNAGRFEESLAVFTQLEEIAPANSQVFLGLGNAHFQLEDFAQAERAWEKAIELDPLEASAYLNLGNLFFKRKNPQGAIRYWQMFRKLSKTHAAVCLNLGLAYDQLGDIEKAFEAYSAYLGLNPASSEAARLHARFESARKAFGNNMIVAEKTLAAGDLNKAREIYEKTLPMYPGGARIYKAYATVLYKQGEYEEAVKYYIKTHRHDPDDATVLINLGVIYERQGWMVDAMWAYDRARRIPSGEQGRVTGRFQNIHEHYGKQIPLYFDESEVLIRSARYDEAKERLERLQDLSHSVTEAAALKFKIQAALERVEEALDPMLKAAKTFYNRGVDAQDNGRFDQALRFFGRYLQVRPNGPRAAEVKERLDAMRKMMGAVVQSLLDSDTGGPNEETPS